MSSTKKLCATLRKTLTKVETKNNVLLHDRKHPLDMRVYEDLFDKERSSRCFERYPCMTAALILFMVKMTWPFFYECQCRQ